MKYTTARKPVVTELALPRLIIAVDDGINALMQKYGQTISPSNERDQQRVETTLSTRSCSCCDRDKVTSDGAALATYERSHPVRMIANMFYDS